MMSVHLFASLDFVNILIRLGQNNAHEMVSIMFFSYKEVVLAERQSQ